MSKKIFIVENELITALDLKTILIKLGFEVVGIAITGPQAVQLINEKSPDLVLMDIFLKGDMTGIEVTKEIEPLNIPVIYLTANTDNKIVSEAMQTTPFGYIKKPFNRKEVARTVKSAFEEDDE